MGVIQLQAAPAVRSRWRDILTLGSMFILGAVWSLFFLWVFALTESWLAQWQSQTEDFAPANWQVIAQTFLASETGIYLPAMILLLTSLVLFFYRVPRVRMRLTVPIEFAATTLIFLVANFGVLYLLHMLIIPALAASTSLQPTALPVIELDILVTLFMLAVLFWLQGSGRLRWYWRKVRRMVRQPLLHRQIHLGD
jgi:hypothetical protein